MKIYEYINYSVETLVEITALYPSLECVLSCVMTILIISLSSFPYQLLVLAITLGKLAVLAYPVHFCSSL